MHSKLIFKIFSTTLFLILVFCLSSSSNATLQEPNKTEKEPFNQAQKLAELNKQIVGKENQPAEEVFKNIQTLKGLPAARLLKIMELGYSRALGVSCTHCHVTDQWEKEDLVTKQIARDMIKMQQTINNDLLKNIKNLKSPNSLINCTSCHRGQIKPALNF